LSKDLQVQFDSMEAGPGVLDIAMRINVQTQDYEFVFEENGLPVKVPHYQLVGLLQMLIGHATHRFWHGYPEEAKEE
jgi:hypothetical protein